MAKPKVFIVVEVVYGIVTQCVSRTDSDEAKGLFNQIKLENDGLEMEISRDESPDVVRVAGHCSDYRVYLIEQEVI